MKLDLNENCHNAQSAADKRKSSIFDFPAFPKQIMASSDNDIIFMSNNCLRSRSNNQDTLEDMLTWILDSMHATPKFIKSYAIKSLVMIGQGAFGVVFRGVTRARGDPQNPKYPEPMCKYLQKVWRTTKFDKNSLIDSYRDSQCLDLISIKVEQLSIEDIETNSVGTIHLIREFFILQTLFSHADVRYPMVGFPLPIDFGYLGSRKVAKALDRIMVYDPYGEQSSFAETYVNSNTIHISNGDVTDTCYVAMELVGPNLDQWKEFFRATHSRNGAMVFSPQTVLKMMDQLLCRLWVMHRKNIVHLDLKPDNVCVGVGRMSNTIYLIDYGLSKICSDLKPDVTLGTRKYMSVAVMSMQPPRYVMDIESWFYVLLHLLCDDLPWSDQTLGQQLSDNIDGGAREEKLVLMVQAEKKAFWGDDGLHSKKIWQTFIKRIEALHPDVPDIGHILSELYEHIRKIRHDYRSVTSERMHLEIRDEGSDLSKRYAQLRKLLLYPYDFNFHSKESCFSSDKDLVRRQEERKTKYKMLTYCESEGRDWLWDWDQWFLEDYPQK